MTKEEKFDLLTNQSVKKAICKMAVPTIFTMLITSLYNMADSYFVSTLGSAAIGAVGVVFSLMTIIQACGFFFGQGSGNSISRMLGNKDYDQAKHMAANGYYSSFAFGLLFAIFGLIFIEPLAKLLGSDNEILPYAKTYLIYILIGAPLMTSSLTLNNQLRFQGNAFYSMVGMCSGSLLNILGDAIMVPLLGMHGAGLSTLIGQLLSFILLRVGIIKSNNVQINIKDFIFSKKIYLGILNGGVPSLFRQGIGSIATICLNHVLKEYGTDAIAAMSVVTRITSLLWSIIVGIGQGFQPVCGYNYGAKKYSRVKEGYFFTVIISFIVLCILGATSYIFAKPLIMFFCKSSDKFTDLDLFLEMGISTLRIHCLFLPILALYGTSNMLMQTMGKSIRATMLATTRQGLFFIPILYIFGNSYERIKFVQPIADVLSCFIAFFIVASIIKELNKGEKENAKSV